MGQATRIHYSLESPVGQIASPLPAVQIEGWQELRTGFTGCSPSL